MGTFSLMEESPYVSTSLEGENNQQANYMLTQPVNARTHKKIGTQVSHVHT